MQRKIWHKIIGDIMKKFLLFIALVLSFAFDANAAKQSKTQGDETSEVIAA